jgi:DNA adenine methylase
MPQIVQYQGSKRALAPRILGYMPPKFSRLLEPFSGMAAVSVAAATEGRAGRYLINDINAPLVSVLEAAVNDPAGLALRYKGLWSEQFGYPGGHPSHFYHVRDSFNLGERTPENMLYLLARCVKGAVRYSKDGKFNQSPDRRRHGKKPAGVARSVGRVSALLSGISDFSALDYREFLQAAVPGDVVYMDPPYQGVSGPKDARYLAGLGFQDFVDSVRSLNERGVDFLISYDGECGGKRYGAELPGFLGCRRTVLDAGPSAQSTLLGKSNTTYEALYVSAGLFRAYEKSRGFQRLKP